MSITSSTSRWRLARSGARLPRAERWAALQALAWLIASHAAVRCCSYRTLRGLMQRVPAGRPAASRLDADACARAVSRASRLFPAAACLAQAVATAGLLRRNGHPSSLTIGVAIEDDRSLRAHAWLESAGATLVGARGAEGLNEIVRDEFPIRP